MNLPSIEFMMIAARGVALLLALATLAWAIVRWRRDTTRDAQRVFEQLDLVRAELLQLQGQMGTASQSAPIQYSYPPTSNPQHLNSQHPNHRAASPAAPNKMSSSAAHHAGYSDFEVEHKALAETRRIASEVIKSKSMTNAAPRGYEVASRLARSGATVAELVSTCALSRHEAELMVRLNAGMKSMQPPASTTQQEQKSASTNSSRAHANLNQLKNIGSRADTQSRPASTTTNRPAPAARPVPRQRVSLVG